MVKINIGKTIVNISQNIVAIWLFSVLNIKLKQITDSTNMLARSNMSRKLVCKKCGKELSADAKFCANCGEKTGK